MKKISESEIVIRRLYEITNDYHNGFNSQITQLLTMGLERFNLDIGILAKVDGEMYTVQHCVAPHNVDLTDGTTFDYKATYCEITCSANSPVAIEHCGEHDVYATHPAYQAFGLESYIGIPVKVDGELYGTLNFSSATPYPRQFKDMDIDVMNLMASWIGIELVRREQQQTLQKLNQKLIHQALHDPLTQLPNRRCLFKTLNAEVQDLQNTHGQGTIAVIDIDLFKLVNDRHGHQVGDDVLKQLALVLKESLLPSEFSARFGGEEFVIWYPHTYAQQAEDKLHILRQQVKNIVVGGREITISIGACHFALKPNDNKDQTISVLDSLISVADECLYSAKAKGRDQLITRHYKQYRTESSVTLSSEGVAK